MVPLPVLQSILSLLVEAIITVKHNRHTSPSTAGYDEDWYGSPHLDQMSSADVHLLCAVRLMFHEL